MRTRRLGRDGPELSVLGLGSWKAGSSWVYGLGEVRDEDSIATIRHGLDCGIDWIDMSVAELVIAYAVAHPAITGAIVGASSGEQIDGWIGAGDLELDEPTVADLTATATDAGYPTAGVEGYTSIDSRASGVE